MRHGGETTNRGRCVPFGEIEEIALSVVVRVDAFIEDCFELRERASHDLVDHLGGDVAGMKNNEVWHSIDFAVAHFHNGCLVCKGCVHGVGDNPVAGIIGNKNGHIASHGDFYHGLDGGKAIAEDIEDGFKPCPRLDFFAEFVAGELLRLRRRLIEGLA